MSDISASEYVSLQDDLSNEARELMPWDASKCTYEMGPLKQQVFACRTHKVGVCYSCSIQCHTKCDIVELFTKRGFTCECGTEKDSNVDTDGRRCQLRKNDKPDIPSLTNRYGHNFEGRFCSCDKEYDPESNIVMLQCILGSECNEDWYHDHCILGDENAPSIKNEAKNVENTSNGIPPLDTFDAFICWRCIRKYNSIFERIISHSLSEKIIAKVLSHNIKNHKKLLENQVKRKIDDVDDTITSTADYSIFLKHNYSEHLKELKKKSVKDDKLYIFLHDLAPVLVEDEPVYEPPMDSNDSTDDLLRNVLQNDFHREQAIAGISALNTLKSKLSDFLKPFAETGQIVKEEDIKNFFSERE